MMVEWDEHMGDLMNGTSPFINNIYIYINMVFNMLKTHKKMLNMDLMKMLK